MLVGQPLPFGHPHLLSASGPASQAFTCFFPPSPGLLPCLLLLQLAQVSSWMILEDLGQPEGGGWAWLLVQNLQNKGDSHLTQIQHFFSLLVHS